MSGFSQFRTVNFPKRLPLDDMPRKAIPQVILAAEAGDLLTLRSLLGQNPSLVSRRARIGDTALHAATSQRQISAAKLLIKYGADINARGNRGARPLHYAVDAECLPIVRLLINHGANVNAKDGRGMSPLQLAVERADESKQLGAIAKLLARHGTVNVNTRIVTALKRGSVAGLRKLIAAHPKAISHHKNPGALLQLALLHAPDLVGLLLDCGIDPNIEPVGWPVPHLFSVSDADVAELLLSHGANPNVKSTFRGTPLSQAKKRGNRELVDVLVRYGAKK